MAQHEAWRRRLDQVRKVKRAEKGLAPSSPSPSYNRDIPTVGSSLYQVRRGESYASIAIDKYGDESYSRLLQDANPNSLTVHPGTILVLPDQRGDSLLANAEPVDFHRDPQFNQFLNSMDLDEKAVSMAFLAEQLSPDFNDRMYLGFDQNDIGFWTIDDSALPVYYHPDTEEFPYSPEISEFPARWGMVEAFPYVKASRPSTGDTPELRQNQRPFDDRTELEKLMQSTAEIESIRLSDPQIYKAMKNHQAQIDAIAFDDTKSITVTGPSGELIKSPTEAAFEDDPTLSAKIEAVGDVVRWIDEPIMAMGGVIVESNTALSTGLQTFMNIVGFVGSSMIAAGLSVIDMIPGVKSKIALHPVTGQRLHNNGSLREKTN